jgi:cysteine desulfurase
MSNNEIGTIQPLNSVVELAKSKNILVHTDAVQCLGKIPVDTKKLDIDFLSLSAHKFYGPKGIGILYVKNRKTINSLLIGGSQENGLRGGTENVVSIAGAGLAAKICCENIEENSKKLKMLQNYFINEIKKSFPDLKLNSKSENTLPGLVNISFPGFKSDILMAKLDRLNIAVSSGSACGSGSPKPSKVLNEIGVEKSLNLSSLRISFGSTNNMDEVKILIKKLSQILNN